MTANWAAAVVNVLVLAFLVFIGKGQVLGRLGDLAPGARLNMTKDCLTMFFHRPVSGSSGRMPAAQP